MRRAQPLHAEAACATLPGHNRDLSEMAVRQSTETLFGLTDADAALDASVPSFTGGGIPIGKLADTPDLPPPMQPLVTSGEPVTAATRTPVTTTFQQVTASGGQYLWSDPTNWTNGVPQNGDTAIIGELGYDDIASLHLATLTQRSVGSAYGGVRVIAGNLIVDMLDGSAGTGLLADTQYLSAGPTASITINAATTGSNTEIVGAIGPGAYFVDNAPVDPGFIVLIEGARVDFHGPLSPYSDLSWGSGPNATAAIFDPGPTIAAEVSMYLGNTIELPGTTVATVTFGSQRVASITTDAGTYAFSNFAQISNLGAYTFAADPATGLVAIKLLATESFNPQSGDSGVLYWSTAADWSSGVPITGDQAMDFYDSVDDLASLNLSLLEDNANLTVVGGALSVGRDQLAGGLTATSGGHVVIDTTARATTGPGAVFGATGAGSTFEDDAASDLGATYTVTDGGRITIAATVNSGSTLNFAGAPGTFALRKPGASDAAALTIGAGDTIELPGSTVTSVSFGANTLTIVTDLGTTTFSNVTYRSAAAGFSSGGGAGAGMEAVTLQASPACFVRGTRILTDRGEVAVEDLTIGDGLVTVSGRVRPLRWIGTRSYAGRFLAGNPDLHAVLIRAGALGDRVPQRDLFVSPKHAMYLDGVLVPALALLDGETIVQPRPGERVDYFHLELDGHDVVLAEGAPAESYVEDGDRAMFRNAAEFVPSGPAFQTLPYCAPRVENGPRLAAIRRSRLERRRA